MHNKKIIIALVILAALIAIMFYLFRPQRDSAITATGMIEVTHANITPKVGGYLHECDFVEGSEVKQGSIIARIDSKDYQLSLLQSTAAYQSAVSKLQDLKAGSRPDEIASQRAAMESAKDAKVKAESDYRRYDALYQKGAISAQQLDVYRVNMTSAQGSFEQAQANYNLAVEGKRIDEISAQQHLSEQMKYAMQAAQTNLDYTRVKAPINGRILSKNYEVGEFVQPGAPIATIGDLSDCWVKIYVPSTYLGKVKLDQQVEVRIDTYPDKVFVGRVKEIATQAEFTPRQTITKDERANLVFAVKIALDNAEQIFKPGMPAEVRIL